MKLFFFTILLLLFVGISSGSSPKDPTQFSMSDMAPQIDAISKTVEENGVKTVSFAVIVIMLFIVVAWILTTFPSQLREERKIFSLQLADERQFFREEMEKNRISDGAKLATVLSNLDKCPYRQT